MTTSDLISDLATRGFELQAIGPDLRVRPAGRLTAADLAALRQHKPVILKLLRCEGREAKPIVPGHEHFSIWADDADGEWQEFVPGFHYDIRQPSRLRGLLAP